MTGDFGGFFNAKQQDEALRRRLQPAPKPDNSPSAEYRAMGRLLSSADCRFLRQQGRSPLQIARFRMSRARQMRMFSASLSARVREGLLEMVTRGAPADSVAADRIALTAAITRLNLLAVAFALGFDVEASANARVLETLKRHLSAQVLAFPEPF